MIMMLLRVFVLLVVVSVILPRNAANHLLTTTETEFRRAQPTAEPTTEPPAEVATTISDSICQFRADIAFLLDGSGSVGMNNFRLMIDFVEKVAKNVTIGQDDVLIAAVLFSSRSKVKFDFTKHTTGDNVRNAIQGISYPGGGTATHLGLNDIRTKIFTASGGHRAGVPQVLIVMTDGAADSQRLAKAEADLAKSQGINVFSLGIGQNINDVQLQEIASDPSKVFRVHHFNQLVNIIGTLAEKTCKAAEDTKKDILVSDLKFDGTDNEINTILVQNVTSRIFGRVFILRGRNSLVTVPRLDVANSSFTFRVYVKVNRFNKTQVIIGDWGQSANTQQYLLSITDNNEIRLNFHFLENGTDLFDALEGGDVAGLNKNDWQVIVVTWNRTDGKAVIYLNGDVVGEKMLQGKTLYPTTSTTNKVGNLPGSGNIYFEGKIARAFVYNFALTPDYVSTFNQLAGIKTNVPTTTTAGVASTAFVTPTSTISPTTTDKPAQNRTSCSYTFENADCSGHDIWMRNVRFAQCRDACSRRADCRSFQYRPPSCWLKNFVCSKPQLSSLGHKSYAQYTKHCRGDEDSGCGSLRQQTGLGGTFSSMNYPRNYSNNANCTWIVTVPTHFRVGVNFSYIFDIETNRQNCYDSVSVYEDASSTKLIGEYCHRPSYDITSQDNDIRVEFNSDGSVVRRGFLLTWTAIPPADSGCGSRYIQSGTRGSISSMNYPYNYQNDADCAWHISVPHGMRVRLEFKGKFEIESSYRGSCNFDTVAVRSVGPSGDFGQTYGVFCGLTVPNKLVLDDEDIVVHFKSDSTTTFAGFSLKWDAIQYACGFPDRPRNGTLSLSDEDRVFSKATYTCDYGFKLVGVNRLCLPSGGWSGTPPRCQEI